VICLIIVDALRYDCLPFLPKWLHVYKCRALANNTEPSITTILTGLTPEEHGVMHTGDFGNDEKLRRVLKPIPNSFIASPAVIFHPFFTYSTTAKYSEEVFAEAKKYMDFNQVDFMLLHLMDVHDYRDINYGMRYYEGFEEMSDEAVNWKIPSGLPRTQEMLIQTTRDAGLLKAKYKGAVVRTFEQIIEFCSSIPHYKIIITADHGEDLTYFAHDGLDVYDVPLITNFRLEEKTYTHLDVAKLWKE